MRANIEAMWEDLGFFLQAKDPSRVFDRFCGAVGRYGFDRIVVGQTFLRGDMDVDQRRFFYHLGVSEFLQVYQDEKFQFSDPVALRAMATHRPFRWHEAHVDMSPRQQKQVKTAEKFGLKYGIVFPIIDRPGPTGFASIGQAQDFDLSADHFLEIEMLVRYAYRTIDRLVGPAEPVTRTQISARETAILSHVAKGKTNWEIGQIMGISEYSVRDYLKALSSRLETSNRTHTVVRAIQLGLILP